MKLLVEVMCYDADGNPTGAVAWANTLRGRHPVPPGTHSISIARIALDGEAPSGTWSQQVSDGKASVVRSQGDPIKFL